MIDGIFELNWRPFIFGFLLIFAVVIIEGLGFRSPINLSLIRQKMLSPLPSVSNLLEKTKNNFKVSEQTRAGKSYSGGDISAKEYLVLDYDSGKVLFEKNPDERLPIASLTKIMTAVVALDLASPQDKFSVSKAASSVVPTKIGVVPNEEFTLNELLSASLMTSANDAVEVIRDGFDKSYGKGSFVKAMNEKAKFLELNNTSFENPQGFDSNSNFSSAHDLAILTHYALENYPLIKKIVSQDYALIPANSDHKKFDLYNWNGLLGVYPGSFGVKIGNTENAGMTTIVGAKRDGKRILAIVLGAEDIYDRDLTAANLLDDGFEKSMELPKIAVSRQSLQTKYNSWVFWN